MTAAASTFCPSVQTHNDQPVDPKAMTDRIVPAPTPTAPTSRRPRTSAIRPPTTTPMAAGVAVSSVKSVMRAPEKPRTSLRKSLPSWLAGVANTASRKTVLASNQKRRPCPAIGASTCGAAKRRLSGRWRCTKRTSGR